MTLLVSILLWMLWGISMASAGVTVDKPGFWWIWGLTLLIAIWYGNRHLFEVKKEG